eukprot:Pompholyxophrys_punicea_v1_NODE_371_length_2119_cov_6.810078.p2 type:complete len:138 gc:universal NODE_371_length_2119_cov_6.810078:1995-1582(-)
MKLTQLRTESEVIPQCVIIGLSKNPEVVQRFGSKTLQLIAFYDDPTRLAAKKRKTNLAAFTLLWRIFDLPFELNFGVFLLLVSPRPMSRHEKTASTICPGSEHSWTEGIQVQCSDGFQRVYHGALIAFLGLLWVPNS